MSKRKYDAGDIVAVATPTRSLLLVCKKCCRKLDGGFGPKGADDLPAALKQELRDTGRRGTVRLVKVGCLSLCPKDAVTVISSSRPEDMLVVPAGTDPAAVLARLD